MVVMNFLCILFTFFELIEVIYLESSKVTRKRFERSVQNYSSTEYSRPPIEEEIVPIQLTADEPDKVEDKTTEEEKKDEPAK